MAFVFGVLISKFKSREKKALLRKSQIDFINQRKSSQSRNSSTDGVNVIELDTFVIT